MSAILISLITKYKNLATF